MRMSEMPAKLASALSKAQAEIKPVAKSGFNPHFKKSYSTLTDVWDAIREPFTKNGLSVMQMTSVNSNGIVLNTVLMHSSGESVQGELPVAPLGTAPQPLGSAISYARRYALLSASGASVDDDDDGNSAQQNAAAAPSMGMGFKPNPTPLPVGAVTTAPVPTVTSPPPPVASKPKSGWTQEYTSPEGFAKAFKEKLVKCPDMKSYEKLFTANDENIMRLLDENAKLHDELISIANQRKEALSKETA
jgi:ERF superfamily